MSVRFKTKRVEGFQEAIEDARKSWNSTSDNLGPSDEKLMRTLSSCKHGSGHDSFLKGIVVWHDITADHSFIPQLYRYHFRDTVSSTSKMHMTRGGTIKAKKVHEFNEFTLVSSVKELNNLIIAYNDCATDKDVEEQLECVLIGKRDFCGRRLPVTKKELFEAIIMTMPIGYELEFGEVTNYLQLKSMYAQRKSHKMSGWSKAFVEWVKSLPYSWLVTGEKNEAN